MSTYLSKEKLPPTNQKQKVKSKSSSINTGFNFPSQVKLLLLIHYKAIYVQMAKFYPRDMSYVLIWENHAFPLEIEVYNLINNGDRERDIEYEERMKSKMSVISVRRMVKNVGLQKVHQVILPKHKKGLFKFSQAGNLVVMAGITESELFVYDSSDIIALLDLIQNEKFIVKFENKEFSQLQKVSFTKNEQCLVVSLKTKVAILAMTYCRYWYTISQPRRQVLEELF